MSRALLKKVPRRHFLRWGHLVNLNLITVPRAVRPDYPFHFQNNSRQCTRNKRSRFSLLLSPDRLHIPTGRQISGSSRPLQQPREARVLPLSPKPRQGRRKA